MLTLAEIREEGWQKARNSAQVDMGYERGNREGSFDLSSNRIRDLLSRKRVGAQWGLTRPIAVDLPRRYVPDSEKLAIAAVRRRQ